MKKNVILMKRNSWKRLQAGIVAFCLAIVGSGVVYGANASDLEASGAQVSDAESDIVAEYVNAQASTEAVAPSMETYDLDIKSYEWKGMPPRESILFSRTEPDGVYRDLVVWRAILH